MRGTDVVKDASVFECKLERSAFAQDAAVEALARCGVADRVLVDPCDCLALGDRQNLRVKLVVLDDHGIPVRLSLGRCGGRGFAGLAAPPQPVALNNTSAMSTQETTLTGITSDAYKYIEAAMMPWIKPSTRIR